MRVVRTYVSLLTRLGIIYYLYKCLLLSGGPVTTALDQDGTSFVEINDKQMGWPMG